MAIETKKREEPCDNSKEVENKTKNIAVLNLGTNNKKYAVKILETTMYLIEQYAGSIVDSSYIYETVPEYVVENKKDEFQHGISNETRYEEEKEEKKEEEKEKEKENEKEQNGEVPIPFEQFQKELELMCSTKETTKELIERCEEYDSFLKNEIKTGSTIVETPYEEYEKETKNMIKENDKIMKMNLEKYKNTYGNSYFYNLALVISTDITNPISLLIIVKYIEQLIRRKKKNSRLKFENRTIDIDIIFFNNCTIFEKNIKLQKEDIERFLSEYIYLNKKEKRILEIIDCLNEEIEFFCIPHLYTLYRFSILLCLNDMIPKYTHPTFPSNINSLYKNFIKEYEKLYNINLQKVNKKMYLLKDDLLYLKEKTHIVGILNVNYDSFSDGSLFVCPEVAVNRMFEMVEQGATIIDIGGESSAPYVVKIDSISERDFVIPVLEKFQKEWYIKYNNNNCINSINSIDSNNNSNNNSNSNNKNKTDLSNTLNRKNKLEKPIISIDTMHYSLFKECVEKDLVDVLNDISACTEEPNIIQVLKMKKFKYLSVILMHKRGNPHTMGQLTTYKNDNVSEEVKNYLIDRLHFLTLNGIPRYRIILDVGLGFAKKAEQSIQLLQNIHLYDAYPLFLGYSRKQFIAYCVGNVSSTQKKKEENNENVDITKNITTTAQNGWSFQVHNSRKDKDVSLYQKIICGGLGIASFAYSKKVDFIRVHDVLETKALFDVLNKLYK